MASTAKYLTSVAELIEVVNDLAPAEDGPSMLDRVKAYRSTDPAMPLAEAKRRALAEATEH